MSDRRADGTQGAVAGSDGIDRAENDAAVADMLRGAEYTSGSRSGGSRSARGPHVDPVTGEVSGTDSGTGGGNPGEDYDDDHTAGSNSVR